MPSFNELEKQRQKIQSELDALKTQEERNIMGQFSTPIELAKDILNHAYKIFSKKGKVRFLDPAIGTGSFFSALSSAFPQKRIESAVGYEIDEHYGHQSQVLWQDTILDYRIGDFVKAAPPEKQQEKYNLIICNPPYVRHHHINGDKASLQTRAYKASHMKLSGLAGLYCYFLAFSHQWMRADGIAGWLIPSEFMDVNYGDTVKHYLLNEVTLLQIHRFDPNELQFSDALVSSAVVWFKKRKPAAIHVVKFTYGGSIDNPHSERDVAIAELENEHKWTRYPLQGRRTQNEDPKLGDFFKVTRGIATGDNKFFVLSLSEIKQKKLPISQFRPILPSPRYLKESVINSDANGVPTTENPLFVLDSKFDIETIQQKFPELYAYLQEGVENEVNSRYLCKHRKLWYSQEIRPESTFYCTYIGRTGKNGRRPFRFILNHSHAIVTNSYLILYPRPALASILQNRPDLANRMFELLNGVTDRTMLDEGRVYGGGMHKLEPKELSNVPVPGIADFVQEHRR